MDEMNFIPILVASLIPMAVGFAYYHKKTVGSAWMESLGKTEEELQEGFNMALVTIVGLVMSFLMAFLINALVEISHRDINDAGELIFYNNGVDVVEFNIATNPGEPLKPLNKIASGGEISRIMLALKTVSSDADEISTLIFDEIDTGISGNMSSVVAQKLATISKNHQVICVTHTAQIASMADNHNYIEKNIESLKAKTDIRLLNENERYIEISRLVGGNNISQYSDKHAKEIISWSKTFKNSLNS